MWRASHALWCEQDCVRLMSGLLFIAYTKSRWTRRKAQTQTLVKASRCFEQDTNNLQIADLILQWLEEPVGKRSAGNR